MVRPTGGEALLANEEVYRREIKYEMSRERFALIAPRLSMCMHRDGFCENPDGYTVRSLYFDTPYETDFYSARDGAEQRKKIRLRLYAPTDETLKLEMKAKVGMEQIKTSLLLHRTQAQALVNGDYTVLRAIDDPFSETLYQTMTVGVYRPHVLIEYKRIAFVAPSNHIRVTFDSNIRYTAGCFDIFRTVPPFAPLMNTQAGVLEVKYDEYLFSYIKEVLSATDALPGAFGKYALACEQI
jgi:hypothetical protein